MPPKKDLTQLEAAWNTFERPKDGQHFKHYKGGDYMIVATGFLEETETPCVIYRSTANGTVWVRTAQNFLELVTHDGIEQPRFSVATDDTY
jgi:hypothetical protein